MCKEKYKNVYDETYIQRKKNFSELLFWEYLYLIILVLFLVHYSLYTICYPPHWMRLNYDFLRVILLSYVIMKFAFMGKVIEQKGKIIFALLLFGAFAYSSFHTGYVEVMDTALLILGAYKVHGLKILKVYTVIKIPFILGTIICSQLGILNNLIYNQNGRIRESFGFVYPTDFAAQIFFLIAVWVLIRGISVSYFELVGILCIALFLKIKCDARCSVISICLLVVTVGVVKNVHIFQREYFGRVWEKIILKICFVLPWIFAGGMILLCRFYTPNNQLMKCLNDLTTQRLRLGKKIFDYYDIKMFGQYVDMQGNGGSLVKPVDYTFIDCSYINILMRFGLVVFIIVLISISYFMIKNRQNTLMICIMLLICLHSVLEHHLFEFHYNIFLILPFVVIETRTIKDLNKI